MGSPGGPEMGLVPKEDGPISPKDHIIHMGPKPIIEERLSTTEITATNNNTNDKLRASASA